MTASSGQRWPSLPEPCRLLERVGELQHRELLLGGPPFPIARSEIRRLYEPAFRFERTFAPVRSVQTRRAQEWMAFASRIR